MSFLDEETRCEYLVEKWRKKLWEIELDIFSYFDAICEKYDIKYFLIAGSALGAVRHKGFIPWDDDIDIGMLRKDLDKFLSVASKELPQHIFLANGINEEKRFDGLIRLRDENSTGVIIDETTKNCHKGVFIELYPFDNIPDSRFLMKKQAFKSRFYYHALCSFCYPKKGVLEGLFRLYVKMIGYNRIYKKYVKNCIKYNKKVTTYVDTPALPMYQKQGIHHFKREYVQDVVSVPFEYVTAKVPQNNHECLKHMFGDYMKLPPVSERGSHHNEYVYYDPFKSYKEYSIEELIIKFQEQNKNE